MNLFIYLFDYQNKLRSILIYKNKITLIIYIFDGFKGNLRFKEIFQSYKELKTKHLGMYFDKQISGKIYTHFLVFFFFLQIFNKITYLF